MTAKLTDRALTTLAPLVLACGASPATVFAAASDEQQRPPNVIYIISDDHAHGDYGFMGNDRVHTPNLDRLAAQSARYPHAYVPASVCRPSLATLLTGLYPHQHGIHFNHPPPGYRELGRAASPAAYAAARQAAVDLFRRSVTLPQVLARHGYASFQAGKHWEGTYRDAHFTEGMTVNRPCFEQPWNRRLPGGSWVAHGNGDAGLLIGRQTMDPVFDFIDRHAQRPFLVWYAPVLPHEPHDAPQRYRSLFTGHDVPTQKDAPKRKEVPDHKLGYYANIAWFDHTVGQLMAHLDRRGLSQNTLLVYVADNGWSNAPGSAKQDPRSKRSPFEKGIRTPLLLHWPGRIEPATHEGLVSSVDLFPTVLSALGVARPDSLPGIDLMPSATGQARLAPGRPVMGAIYPGDASSLGHPERDVAYRWIRQGNLKLIVPHARPNAKPWKAYVTRTTLYDLGSDPAETGNLAEDPRYAADERRLRQLLDAWWPAAGPR